MLQFETCVNKGPGPLLTPEWAIVGEVYMEYSAILVALVTQLRNQTINSAVKIWGLKGNHLISYWVML